jgi:release factor glutamine methyltransferase
MKITEQQKNWLLKSKYNGQTCQQYFDDIKRLTNGEPLDFVIGNTIFLDCFIDLSQKPLIPRDETEYWVNQAINQMPKDKPIKVLDLFCGSGCIGLAILKHLPNAKVDFADISDSAIKQTKINLALNKFDKTRAKVIKSDVLKNINGKYDYIFANPPYIPNSRKLFKSVINFEPKQALFAGVDGLKYIKIVLKDVKLYLKPSAILFMEIDSTHSKFCKVKKIEVFKDQYNRPRYIKYNVK